MDAKQRQERVSLEVIEPGKDPYYKAALERLKRLLQDEAELSRLSLALGKSARYLSNLFSEGGTLSLPGLLQLSQLTGIPPEVFVQNTGPKRIWLPEQLLHRERERGTKVKQESAFLSELAPRLEKLTRAKVEPVLPGRRRTLLDPLEDERFRNRQGAMRQTEALVAELTAECETKASKGALLGPRLGELSGAVALWATIQRTLGLRNLAIQAFQLSFPLARHSQDPWASGTNHQRAAHVLRDLDRPDLALDFISEALWKFDSIDSAIDRWRCFVDRGTFLCSLPDHENAIESFNMALKWLPEAQHNARAGAYQGLAYSAQSLGRLREALDLANKGIAASGEGNNILAYLKWRKAAILTEIKQIDEAKANYREGLALMANFGSSGELALMTLDFAEALVAAGRAAESICIAKDLTQWLPRLRANPILHRAMSTLSDLMLVGRLNLSAVEEARRKLKHLQPEPLSSVRPQPPTETTGPNSGSSPG